MNDGTVAWYNLARSFGMLDSDGRKVFFHLNDLRVAFRLPRAGDRVTFDLYQDPKDPSRYIAKNVVLEG